MRKLKLRVTTTSMKKGQSLHFLTETNQDGARKSHNPKLYRGYTSPSLGESSQIPPRQHSLKSISLSEKSSYSVRSNGHITSRQNSVQSSSPDRLSPKRSPLKKNGVAPAPVYYFENGKRRTFKTINNTTTSNGHVTTDVNEFLENSSPSLDNRSQALGTFASIFLPISLATVIVGLATPFWIRRKDTDIGIFQTCDTWSDRCTLISSDVVTKSQFMIETWQYVQRLQLAGSVLLFIAFICICIYSTRTQIDRWKMGIGIMAAIWINVAASLLIGSMVLFICFREADDKSSTFGWSFYTNSAGSGLALLSGILFIAHIVLTCKILCCKYRADENVS